jgi:hypothetical protein
MTFRCIPLAALLVTSLPGAVAGCGGTSTGGPVTETVAPAGPPVRLGELVPFYVPGETMVWEVSLHGIIGGEAVLAVGDPGTVDGRPAIVVRSRVETVGAAAVVRKVRDEVTTHVDLDTGRPIAHQADLLFGDKHTVLETEFLADGYRLEYVRNGSPARHNRQSLDPADQVHDGHSVIGALRAWDPEPGARAYFYGLGGKRLWRNTLHFAGRETITTAMGTFPALRIDGTARRLTSRLTNDPKKKPRSYSLWISDDGQRLPLRVTAMTEYGDVKVELIDYQAPEPMLVRR